MSAPFLSTSGTTPRLALRLQNFRGGSERNAERNNATALDGSESYEQRVNLRVSASEDQADAERVLAGDVSAFEGIVRRWQAPLVNLAYRFCRDRGRAEEMAQEAFLRAYRGLRQWRRDAAFSTWLFAVATNLYRSELRRIPDRTVSIEDVTELRDSRPSDGGLAEEDSLPGGAERDSNPSSQISRPDDPVLFPRDGYCGRGPEPQFASGHREGQIISWA